MGARLLNRKSTYHGLIYYIENVRWHIFPHIKYFNMAKLLLFTAWCLSIYLIPHISNIYKPSNDNICLLFQNWMFALFMRTFENVLAYEWFKLLTNAIQKNLSKLLKSLQILPHVILKYLIIHISPGMNF